uniref:calcium-transporting P-type ATPase, PMR1-type n=1 Tax=Desulforadius tongensis TaxID=1216062 RepID=UPI00195F006C|nr:calcium-transporting P-type ATPase, PMR1-type [Desulforadius tongensis]
MAGKWHVMDGQDVVNKLGSSAEKGLDEREAKGRLKHFGPNQLVAAPKSPPWVMFLNQFKDFMVLVLIAATVVSGFLHEWADAITIIIIVVVNAVLGFVQEFRAEKSMEALKQLAAPEAKVIRNGAERRVPAAELVPGDVVLLESGDKVPADMRLLETVNLEVEESSLTGESNPVPKRAGKMERENVSVGDTCNMAYMGTVVTRGRARGIVVSTGMASEMGQIAGMIQEVGEEQTPLQRRLAQLGKVLVAFCLFICALVVVLGVMRGEPAYRMFLAGVSLAVAAIPEGLPAIVTIALAIGVQRMIKRNSIIRRLPAVETLGCATVICSDKTGTLTQNKMTVRRVVTAGAEAEVSGEGYSPRGDFTFVKGREGKEFRLLLKAAALCNNSVLTKGEIGVGGLLRRFSKPQREWNISGDPTEGALLVMAAKAGIWRRQIEKEERRVAELPFDSDRKRMTVIYSDKNNNRTAYVKGAPDVVLELCTRVYSSGKILPMTTATRKSIARQNAVMAGEALRVLALAVRELPSNITDYNEDTVERNLVFLGLAGMIDPPRPEALQAVLTCRRAGIKTVMITGDHRLTARAIGEELGLLGHNGKVLTGVQLDAMDDETLQREAENVAVYARVSPRHKLRIVRALKNNGHVVAMTGDGVNDAPAVKEADIGIAMGKTGTDVTKEASSMVLADDNFKSIVDAVEEGRGIYDNIRKFIRYLLSCNVGEVLVMFLAVLGGLPLPLLPIQILWMNLVTDGLPAMALGVDPAHRDIMNRPPRHPQESVFANGLGWRILGSGTVIALGTLVAFCLGLVWRDEALARTMAFNTLVFFQLFYVFVCRSEHHSILDIGLFTNPHLLVAVAVSAALQLMVVYVPFLQPIFKTVPLQPLHWVAVLVISFTPTFLSTITMQVRRRARRHFSYLRV